MADVALIGRDKSLAGGIGAALKLRPDIRVVTYRQLGDVDILHSLFIVDLGSLGPSEHSIKNFLAESRRLLNYEESYPTGSAVASFGRDFKQFAHQTVVLVPSIGQIHHVFINCGISSHDEMLDVRRLISSITLSFQHVISDSTSLSDIIEQHLPLKKTISLSITDRVLEITSYDKKRFGRINENDPEPARLLAEITESLVALSEAVRGDNSTLGRVLRQQMIALIDMVAAELRAPLVDRQSVATKNRDMKEIGEKIEGATKRGHSIAVNIAGICRAIQRLLDLLF